MKIFSLDELTKTINRLKSEGKKIVHCHGIFDILHIGHIRYLEQAKQMGDILIVTITPDRFVNKGHGRPVFNEHLRSEAVASLNVVDFVAINEWPDAVNTIMLLRPDIYVRGADYRDRPVDTSGVDVREEEAVKKIGSQIAYTDDIHFSSTSIINRFLRTLPDEVQEYLQVFLHRFKKELTIMKSPYERETKNDY